MKDILKYIIDKVSCKIISDIQFDYAKWDSIPHYNLSNVLFVNVEKLKECLVLVSESSYYQALWNKYLIENPYMDSILKEKYLNYNADKFYTYHKDMVFLSHFLRFSYIIGIYTEPISSVAGNQVLGCHYYLHSLKDVIIRYGRLSSDKNKSKSTTSQKKMINPSLSNPETDTTQSKKNFQPNILQTQEYIPLIENSLDLIPAYQAVSKRMKEYAKPYQEFHIHMGKRSYLNDFECFILQLIYQINILFEEDIRIIINAINTEKKKYSLITTIRKLRKLEYINQHSDDTFGKFYSYTGKAEKLLNTTIKYPENFKVTQCIERYRLISSFTTIQLSAKLKEPFMENLKKRMKLISFGNHGFYAEKEKSNKYFRNIKINDTYISVLDLEEEYTKLIKAKTAIASQRSTLQKKMKLIMVDDSNSNKVLKMMEQSKNFDKQIATIQDKMNSLRVYLGDNYFGMKKETVPTLRYFLRSGLVWSITTDGYWYQCNVTFLDFSLYGNQENLYKKVCALSSYFQNRLNSTNFHIKVSVFRADDERKKEYVCNIKKVLDKVDIAMASGQRLLGIDKETFIECRDGKENYRIYNILKYYSPYKNVIPLRFAEKEYKREYYKKKKNKDLQDYKNKE